MQADIISIQDLSDSKEVLLKKIPISIKVSIIITLSVLVVLLIVMCFCHIDICVPASGELRPYVDQPSVSSNSGGKIITSYHKSGDQIRCGEPLFDLCRENLEKQKNMIQSEINKKEHSLWCNNRFLKSIEKNQNLCEKNSEQYDQFENYKFEITQLENSDAQSCGMTTKTLDCEKNKIKTSYISNAQQIIDKLNTEKISLELQLSTILDSIEKTSIVAVSDGILNLNKNLLPGEVIPPNTDIGYIVPNKNNLKVSIFVPEKYISVLHIDQDVVFTLDSPYLKKRITGKIYQISPDSVTDKGSLQAYYHVESSVLNCEEQTNLRPGMKVKPHIVTGRQTFFDYILSLL